MTLKLRRELGIRLQMQKHYRKTKAIVTVDQKPNLIRQKSILEQGRWQNGIISKHLSMFIVVKC